jgi:membrane fusion protein, multidrug efflux system
MIMKQTAVRLLAFVYFSTLPAAIVAAAETLSAKGVVKANAEATITTDLSTRIVEMPFREGEVFRKGDILVDFDCARLKSEIVALQASSRAEELVFENNRRLLSRGAIGANEVKISQAKSEKARAETQALATRALACSFKAPYDGIIVQRLAQQHETPGVSQPVLRIVSMGQSEIEVIVPSSWLRWMKPKTRFQFRVDDSGVTAAATVTRIGAIVDPVSQTTLIYGNFDLNNQFILPGMSGAAMFNSSGS